jgi:hypothetical protein
MRINIELNFIFTMNFWTFLSLLSMKVSPYTLTLLFFILIFFAVFLQSAASLLLIFELMWQRHKCVRVEKKNSRSPFISFFVGKVYWIDRAVRYVYVCRKRLWLMCLYAICSYNVFIYVVYWIHLALLFFFFLYIWNFPCNVTHWLAGIKNK